MHASDRIDGRCAALCGNDVVSMPPQRRCDDDEYMGLVIYDQNSLWSSHRSVAQLTAGAQSHPCDCVKSS
jgi:hypothetical protein